LGGVLRVGEIISAYGLTDCPAMDLSEIPRLERNNFLLGTGIYVCLLRKRCVSVSSAPLKTLAAERIYLYVV
jgi:hypothetical protein